MDKTETAGGVFQAIADPTRRRILAHLRASAASVGSGGYGELTPTQIAAPLSVTLSAVSQHLKVLRDARLVSVRRAGRERWYRLDAAPLREVAAWAGEYERFWSDTMDSLAAYLDEEERNGSDDEDEEPGDAGS